MSLTCMRSLTDRPELGETTQLYGRPEVRHYMDDSIWTVYRQYTHYTDYTDSIQTIVYRQYTDSIQTVYRLYRQYMDSIWTVYILYRRYRLYSYPPPVTIWTVYRRCVSPQHYNSFNSVNRITRGLTQSVMTVMAVTRLHDP